MLRQQNLILRQQNQLSYRHLRSRFLPSSYKSVAGSVESIGQIAQDVRAYHPCLSCDCNITRCGPKYAFCERTSHEATPENSLSLHLTVLSKRGLERFRTDRPK